MGRINRLDPRTLTWNICNNKPNWPHIIGTQEGLRDTREAARLPSTSNLRRRQWYMITRTTGDLAFGKSRWHQLGRPPRRDTILLRAALRYPHRPKLIRRGLHQVTATVRDTSSRRRCLLTHTITGTAWGRCTFPSSLISIKTTPPPVLRHTNLQSLLITHLLRSMVVPSLLLEVVLRVMVRGTSFPPRRNRHRHRQGRKIAEERMIWIYGRGDHPGLSNRRNQDISVLFHMFHTLHIHLTKCPLFPAQRAWYRCGFFSHISSSCVAIHRSTEPSRFSHACTHVSLSATSLPSYTMVMISPVAETLLLYL